MDSAQRGRSNPRRAVGRVEVAVVSGVVEPTVTERRRLEGPDRYESLAGANWVARLGGRCEVGAIEAAQDVFLRRSAIGAHGEACRCVVGHCAKGGGPTHPSRRTTSFVAPLDAEELPGDAPGLDDLEVVVGGDHVADRSR